MGFQLGAVRMKKIKGILSGCHKVVCMQDAKS